MFTEISESVSCQLAVQVRLGSQRLPSKAVLPLGSSGVVKGVSVLDWVLSNLRQSKIIERFLLLCPECDVELLAPYADRHGYILFSGSEFNVYQRFYQAIKVYPCKYFIRATADNPLCYGELADHLWACLQTIEQADYIWQKGLPHGVGLELIHSKAFLTCATKALKPFDLEHVTAYLYNHPEDYSLYYPPLPYSWEGYENLRLTLDTETDYHFLQSVFTKLKMELNTLKSRAILKPMAKIFQEINVVQRSV